MATAQDGRSAAIHDYIGEIGATMKPDEVSFTVHPRDTETDQWLATVFFAQIMGKAMTQTFDEVPAAERFGSLLTASLRLPVPEPVPELRMFVDDEDEVFGGLQLDLVTPTGATPDEGMLFIPGLRPSNPEMFPLLAGARREYLEDSSVDIQPVVVALSGCLQNYEMTGAISPQPSGPYSLDIVVFSR